MDIVEQNQFVAELADACLRDTVYVRIPGVGLRHVDGVRVDDDGDFILDIAWLPTDIGKEIEK